MKKLEWRMYGITPYNISEIQKGIQFGHAVQEYNNIMFDDKSIERDGFDKWRTNDKTFMVMNGGTTNDDISDKFYGSINRSLEKLKSMGITIGVFREPDLGNQVSAVVFLADERCFKKKPYPWDDENVVTYPDFVDYLNKSKEQMLIDRNEFIIKSGWPGEPTLENIYPTIYNNWVELIGGVQNVGLRKFIDNLRFA